MPNHIRLDLHTIDDTSFPYVFEQNVTVHLKSGDLVRCNVYRPKTADRVPVLVTYGPYGKDIHYKDFSPKFAEVNPRHKSAHSAWETPDPGYWTAHGYAIVRADEVGTGQSPGVLDTMSPSTTDAFAQVIEWAAEQPWSSGKIGLLGVSYYAGSQWRVAARRPKGLACIIPWEGMSDYYRDRCRHGGIYSNGFIKWWWDRQVITNQYGRPGRAAANWGPDTLEGDLPESELLENRRDQVVENRKYRYRDDEYHACREYNLADIEVPLLSVGNWGGILLHLRGNIEGFTHAGSKLKYLRMITGRHDLPFYYDDEVEIQRSFLDAFLKGEDRVGWSQPGKVPPINLVIRKGNVGVNNPDGEATYPRREEYEWPLARTQYTKFYLHPDRTMRREKPRGPEPLALTYHALLTPDDWDEVLHFITPPFEEETEITGHIIARLCVSVSADRAKMRPPKQPTDIDLFLTLRHIGPDGCEIYYTGTAGDPVPLTKGWLRVSLRKVNEEHPWHRPWLPYREYRKVDQEMLEARTVYTVDVEIWPTCVVVEKGSQLLLEVSSGDTQGCGIFTHDDEYDRDPEVFQGWNHIHFGPDYQNYVVLPIIPPREEAAQGNRCDSRDKEVGSDETEKAR